jgi:OFA family oxalate/formate antiporter-like MFS transporter
LTQDRNPRRKPRVFYGWIIVGVVAMGSFTHSAETFPILSVFLKPMTEEFGWSRSAFTGAMTIGTLLAAVIAVFIGPMMDRFNPRWLMAVAFLVMGGSFMLMSQVTELWQFYLVQIASRAVHMGVISVAIAVIIPKWFVAKRGKAVSIGAMGNRAGGVAIPLFTQAVVNISNWRWATFGVGLLIIVVSVLPSALFLKRKPEDIGQLPDGALPDEIEKSKQQSTNKPLKPKRQQRQEVSYTVRQVVRMRSFYLLTTAFALMFIINPATSLHTIPFLTDQGLSTKVAVATVSTWAATGLVGTLLAGYMADHFNLRAVAGTQYVLLAASFIFLQMVDTASLAIAWGLYYGLIQGGSFIFQQVMLANYYGRESLGAIRGLVWPVQSVANAIGPIAAAFVYDQRHSYTLAFNTFFVLALIAATLTYMAKPPRAPDFAATIAKKP